MQPQATVELPAQPEWEPISDIPCNLASDGRNYVEWVWALLDDGIDIDIGRPFAELKTDDGQQLLTKDAANYLDGQLVVAMAAAASKGYDLRDVVLCCRAPFTDSGAIADELATLFSTDRFRAIARAKALAQICDAAEEFCKDAIHLKWNLAADDCLAPDIRKAFSDGGLIESE